MQIADVKTILVCPESHRAGMIGSKNWLFVRIETDDGIVGWGECYTQLDRDRAIERHVHEIGRYLDGRSPFDIKAFTHMVYADFSGRRGSMDLYCAQSGIEQALWDIVGKALDRPVYDLLGGACQRRIRVYANGWYGGAKEPDDYARMAQETVARGFDALKFDPFPGPWCLYVTKELMSQAEANVAAVREAVGGKVDLLIEGHRRLAPMHAVRFARCIERYDPFWYEEPIPADNPEALAEARRQITPPVVTGETLYTKQDFRSALTLRCADIINPDVCNCGGILELREIAAMAEPHFVGVAPHNYNSTSIGLAATLQAAAGMPNFVITEYFLNFASTSEAICDRPLAVDDGYIALPEQPGLGMSLIEDAMAGYPYQKHPRRVF